MRKTIDQLPTRLTPDTVRELARFLFGVEDSDQLVLYEVEFTQNVGLYSSVLAGAPRSKTFVELRTFIIPEFSQSVRLGYDADRKLVLYEAKVGYFNCTPA